MVCVAGERFELFWNEEDQRWHYRDAVRLDAEQAARCDTPDPDYARCSSPAVQPGPDSWTGRTIWYGPPMYADKCCCVPGHVLSVPG